MPFGSGKSLPAYFLAQEIGAKRILIAVPSLFLIRQTIEVWLREMLANRQDVDWICVCSDESAWHVDRDDVAVLRQILGVPCLTDSEKISEKKPNDLQVHFTTYQSGEFLSEAARSARVRFDLGIMAEAHKTRGEGRSSLPISSMTGISLSAADSDRLQDHQHIGIPRGSRQADPNECVSQARQRAVE
jgi:predicted helicase